MRLPGQEFGSALGDVLVGASEPRGRLPMSWPESVDVAIEIPRRGFAHWDGAWSVEPGAFAILVGLSSTDISGEVEVTL